MYGIEAFEHFVLALSFFLILLKADSHQRKACNFRGRGTDRPPFFLFFISNPDCECPVLAAALERTVLLNFDSVTRLRNMQAQKLAEIIAVKLKRFFSKTFFHSRPRDYIKKLLLRLKKIDD